MGFDLSDMNGQYLYLNRHSWHEVLSEAFDNGWRPLGAIYRDDVELLHPQRRMDGYFYNYCFSITADDADALADALEQSAWYGWCGGALITLLRNGPVDID